jgi:uncharacterized protein (TIGR00369 family)
MTDVGHYRRLERAYASAPVTQWYGAVIRIDDGTAEVRLPIRPEFHHAAGAVHGSVYFRILDDAGFFAANSVVTDVLVLTVSYTIHFLRPVQAGELRATGRLVHAGGQLLVAESQLFDAADRLLGQRGTGNREQGTGNRERGTGNGNRGPPLRRDVCDPRFVRRWPALLPYVSNRSKKGAYPRSGRGTDRPFRYRSSLAR